MKERILTGWTVTRILYLVMGIAVMVQGLTEQVYWGIAFGAYFAAMGLFNFGCAAGCYGGNYYTGTKHKTKNEITTTDFEEVKSK